MVAVTALTTGVLRGAELVAKWRSGKANERDIARLCVRYWGCVLFECDANLDAIAGCAEDWKAIDAAVAKLPVGSQLEIGYPAPVLSFAAYDALVGELARLCALPAILGMAGVLVADLRSIAELIRLDHQVKAQRMPLDRPTYQPMDVERTWLEACKVRLERDWIPRFNSLRDLIADAGRAAYEDDWQSEEAAVLPAPRDVPRST